MTKYDYVVVGAGIAGSCVSYFLKDENLLLVDRRADVAQYASGAAGGFLSPLLGKPNKFKDLVTNSLKFAIDFYTNIDKSLITKNGVVRVPKNNDDEIKFKEYEKHMDFKFKKEKEGYFFEIGAQVNSYEMCKKMTHNINKKMNYDIKHIKYLDNYWVINDEIKCSKLILTSGCDLGLIDEEYINIKAVWGQRIDIQSTTCIDKNYHKECSLSSSKKDPNSEKFISSIGATHHRFKASNDIFKSDDIKDLELYGYTKELYNNDTSELLEKANDIMVLNDVEVIKKYFAPRASSFDYFPVVGDIINSNDTINMFPHLKNGTHVRDERFLKYKNLFILNGVGGRGFVLSPFLAKSLVEFIKNNISLDETITSNRLFKKWVRRQN